MNLESWKKLEEKERLRILRNVESFNPYSDEAYDLVRALGEEFANSESYPVFKVGVLNRFGELIVHLHIPDDLLPEFKNTEPMYYGFRVFYSGESAWFEH